MSTVRAAVLGAPVLVLVLGAPAAATMPEAGQRCGGCHVPQWREWEGSLHARSAEEPIYRAVRAWARREAPEAAALCDGCHTVALAGGGRTPAVTCGACHQRPAVAAGPEELRVDPEAPVAGRRTVDAPHPVHPSPGLVSGEGCLACHGELRNRRGVPLCTTGPESAARHGGVTCLRCHMPGGSHRFPGADPAMLRRALELGLSLRGDQLEVSVVNRGAGHAVPTGPALRQVVLEVRLLDRHGRELARHREIFARVLADAEGHAPAPPWRAVRTVRDTRLQPSQRRTVRIPVPPGARRAVARLVHHRLPPPLADRLGVSGEPLARPVEMARVERELVP